MNSLSLSKMKSDELSSNLIPALISPKFHHLTLISTLITLVKTLFIVLLTPLSPSKYELSQVFHEAHDETSQKAKLK